MTSSSHAISPQLAQSYRDAVYVVHLGTRAVVLTVGQVSDELSGLMRERNVVSAAFLTAFNPHSVIANEQKNALQHSALIADLNALGCECIAGEGGDSQNLWPKELSILALDIPLEGAELIADRYQQNAFLWISSNDGLVSLNLRYPISAEADAGQLLKAALPGLKGRINEG